MILGRLLHYQRSFKYSTALILSFGAWQNRPCHTVFDAILRNRQTCEKLQCFYENLVSNNFRKTAVLNSYQL